jgi:hypothetical protein
VHSRDPVKGSVCFLFVLPLVFSDKMEGLSRITVFLAGQTMVLGELLTG